MQYSSRHLEELIDQLSKLPGIGKKTAQRLAFHILKTDQEEAMGLARAITRVRTEVGHLRTLRQRGRDAALLPLRR